MHDFSHDKPKRIATFGTHDYLEVRCDSGSKRSKVKVAGATKWVGVGCGHWMHVFFYRISIDSNKCTQRVMDSADSRRRDTSTVQPR